jgi:hypothetical protein
MNILEFKKARSLAVHKHKMDVCVSGYDCDMTFGCYIYRIRAEYGAFKKLCESVYASAEGATSVYIVPTHERDSIETGTWLYGD